MTKNMRRRLDRLDGVVSVQRRLMRERVERAAQRLGGVISPADTDVLVTRHMGTPSRIQAWHRAGLTDVQILERLELERDGGGN